MMLDVPSDSSLLCALVMDVGWIERWGRGLLAPNCLALGLSHTMNQGNLHSRQGLAMGCRARYGAKWYVELRLNI